MKGGIILTREWQNRDEEALLYFMENCGRARILTDYSLSCVTYVLTFNPANPALSPYRRMRSSNLAENVTCILLKIGLRSRNRVASYANLSRWDPANPQMDPYNNEIQQVPEEDFRREVETQHRVFTDSFLHHTSPCEPICPGIITSSWTPSQRVIDRIRAVLLGPTLQQRTNVGRRKPRDVDITRNLLDIQPGINIIAMEFMEGFQTLYSLSNDPRYGKFKIMHFFELLRLRIYFNTIHTDAHEENVMIDPRYNYFTNSGPASPWQGRAIIIDFGRVQSEQAQMTVAQIPEIYRIYQNHMALLPAIDRSRIQEYIQNLFTRRETMVATFLATLYPGQLDELNYRVQAHTVQMNPAAAPARQLVAPAAPAALPRQLGPRQLVAPAAPAAGFFDSILQYASFTRIFSFGNRLLNIFGPAAPAPAAPPPAAPAPAAPPPVVVAPAAPVVVAPAAPVVVAPAPVVVAPAPAPAPAPASNFGECTICLLEFDGNDPITQVHTTIPCRGDQCHFFHTQCYDRVRATLRVEIPPCPICRMSCDPPRDLLAGTQIDIDNNIIPPGAAAPAPAVVAPAPAPAAPAPAVVAPAPAPVDVAAVNAQVAQDAALARQLRNDDLARFARQGGPAPAPAVPAPAGLGVGYDARQGGPAPARVARQGGPAPVVVGYAERADDEPYALGIADAVRAARERDERAEDERLARERDRERVARERDARERVDRNRVARERAYAPDQQVPIPMELDVEDAPAVENLDAIILQRINQMYTNEISLINGFLAEWDESLTALANFYQGMLNHLDTRDISQTQTLGIWQRDRPNVIQAEERILNTRASIDAIVTTIQAFTVRYNGNEVNIPRDTIIAMFLNHYNPRLQFYDGRIASVCNMKNTMRHNLINLFGAPLVDPLLVGGAILIKRKNDIKKNQTSNNLYVIYDFFGIPFKAYATKLYNTKSLEFLAKIEGSDNFNSLNDDNIPLTEIQYDILNLSTNKFMEKYNINTMKIENNDIDINEIKKNLNNELNDVSYLSTDNKESSGGKKNITKRYTKRLTKRFTKHLNKRFTKRLNKRLKKRSTKRLNKQYTKRFTKRSTKLYKKS
jgi:hypothetical protein